MKTILGTIARETNAALLRGYYVGVVAANDAVPPRALRRIVVGLSARFARDRE